MTYDEALTRLRETLEWYDHADMRHKSVLVPVAALRAVVESVSQLDIQQRKEL